MLPNSQLRPRGVSRCCAVVPPRLAGLRRRAAFPHAGGHLVVYASSVSLGCAGIRLVARCT